MEQFTKEEAIAIAESGVWKDLDDEEIVKMQLFQRKLCMDFSRFHEAMEKVLDRPVYIHEFASSNYNNLIEEYLGEKDSPSFEDIINLIPEEKRIVIGV